MSVLGYRQDINNAIFMTNAYPWSDAFGVLPSDDFSRRANGQQAVLPQQQMQPHMQRAPAKSHWLLWAVVIGAVIIYLMNR